VHEAYRPTTAVRSAMIVENSVVGKGRCVRAVGGAHEILEALHRSHGPGQEPAVCASSGRGRSQLRRATGWQMLRHSHAAIARRDVRSRRAGCGIGARV